MRGRTADRHPNRPQCAARNRRSSVATGPAGGGECVGTLRRVKPLRRVLLVLGVAGLIGGLAGCGGSRPSRDRTGGGGSSKALLPVTRVLLVGLGAVGIRPAASSWKPTASTRCCSPDTAIAGPSSSPSRWANEPSRATSAPATSFPTSTPSPARSRRPRCEGRDRGGGAGHRGRVLRRRRSRDRAPARCSGPTGAQAG